MAVLSVCNMANAGKNAKRLLLLSALLLIAAWVSYYWASWTTGAKLGKYLPSLEDHPLIATDARIDEDEDLTEKFHSNLTEKLHSDLSKKLHSDQPPEDSKPPPNLSPEIIASIKKFVYFVGYHRSGHSIIGSLLDAHPHIVVAHEYFISSHFPELNRAASSDQAWKQNLFNKLYRESLADVRERQHHSLKGYSLAFDGLWQGRFNQSIEIIGDKSGGRATKDYMNDRDGFKRNYLRMKAAIGIPIYILHVLRNPFDMISTSIIIDNIGNKGLGQAKTNSTDTLEVPDELKHRIINSTFQQYDAVLEMIDRFMGQENVLEIHNSELVSDPKGTILKMLDFLNTSATDLYLDTCAGKTYKSVSRTRDLVVWGPADREQVETRMKAYEMLDRYSFTSD